MGIGKLATLGVTLFSALVLGGSPALAQAEAAVFQTNLGEVNGSGASGTATIEVRDNEMTVRVHATGTSPNLPHAQHIHIGGQGVCPGPEADEDDDGFVSTTEAQPFVGDIGVSLTTEGDTSPDSGLAVDRMPVADESGTIDYQRTFAVPEGVSLDDMENGVVVIHGISEVGGDPTQYDGEARSDLDPELSAQATLPAACGALSAAPVDAVDTGGGATAGLQNIGLAVAGLIAATSGIVLAVRKFVSRQTNN